MTYTIYHIPGIKIGVTTRPNNRIKEQGFSEWEILEVHTDIYEASDREQELQRQYGYQVDDVKFHITYFMAKNNMGRSFSEEVNKRKGRVGNTNALGFKHTESAKQAIKKAVNDRPIIECPKCQKIVKGNSKFKQHYNSARCRKTALKNE